MGQRKDRLGHSLSPAPVSPGSLSPGETDWAVSVPAGQAYSPPTRDWEIFVLTKHQNHLTTERQIFSFRVLIRKQVGHSQVEYNRERFVRGKWETKHRFSNLWLNIFFWSNENKSPYSCLGQSSFEKKGKSCQKYKSNDWGRGDQCSETSRLGRRAAISALLPGLGEYLQFLYDVLPLKLGPNIS